MTQQIPDTIIYKRKRYSIPGQILKPYFERYPERQPVNKQMCTALWRGYRAVFHIRNNRLYVKDILAFSPEDRGSGMVSVLDNVMPDSKTVFWFTGLVMLDRWQLPRNRPLKETIDGFAFRNGCFEGQFSVDQSGYEKLLARYKGA